MTILIKSEAMSIVLRATVVGGKVEDADSGLDSLQEEVFCHHLCFLSLVMLSSLLRTSIICDFELGEKSDSNVIIFIALISFTRWLIKAVPMGGSLCLYKVTRCKR